MTDMILLHPRTKSQVAQYDTAPCHAALLVAPHGMGKTFLAQNMLADALGLSTSVLPEHPYYMHIQSEGSAISIETIRELQKFLQLKTVGHEKQWRRAVIVEHAEALTIEAQNAFLKVLEEPPADTLILLTANGQRVLLPTILSRVQTITVFAPTESDIKAYFARTADEKALTQAYFLSGGLPGLMAALLSNSDSHPLAAGASQAKELLQKSAFERLALVEPLSKKKDEAVYMLEALARIARTGLAQATVKHDMAKLRQWHRVLKRTHEAQTALGMSANTKLALTNMMLYM